MGKYGMLLTRKHLNYKYYEPKDSLVYIVKGHRHYKIGHSTSFAKRLNELQIGNEYPLTVVALIHVEHPKKLEKELQSIYLQKQRRGEWYSLTTRDIADLSLLALLSSSPQQKPHASPGNNHDSSLVSTEDFPIVDDIPF